MRHFPIVVNPLLRILALSLLVAGTAQADEVTYVRAGRLIDVVDGRLLTSQTIVVVGERIDRVADSSTVEIPPAATIIDLTNATVLPGLIDMHVHLIGDASSHGYAALAASLPRSTLSGAANARRTLAAGFTTVRNTDAAGFADVALRDAINEGDVPGPRMRVSGPAIGITGGHCDSNLLPPEFGHRLEGVADGPWEIRERIRRNVKYGADLTKFCATGGVASKGTSVQSEQYTPEEMAAIVEESHRHGLKVAAHAHGTAGIKAAITAGVDSVEHASLIDSDGIRMAVERGTFLVMDVYVTDYILGSGEAVGFSPESIAKEREVGQIQRENFARAVAAGARIAFGTDAGVFPHGANARQFRLMVEYGMTPMQAIQAATVDAAELLGWPGEVGAVAPGHYADLVAVHGNPLEDIRLLEDVRFVMKGGVVYR